MFQESLQGAVAQAAADTLAPGASRANVMRMALGRAVPEETPGFWAGAYPQLFPDGRSDITFLEPRTDRKVGFDLGGTRTEDLSHWLNRLLLAPDGRFAADQRFVVHFNNVLARLTMKGSKATYERNSLDAAEKTVEELLAELRGGLLDGSLHSARAMTGSVQGTDAYFAGLKKELDMCIFDTACRENRWPSYFASGSCAEFHHPDLLRVLAELHHLREVDAGRQALDDAPVQLVAAPGEEDTYRVLRNRLVRENPQVVSEFFWARTVKWFDTVLKPLWGVDKYWLRFEFAPSRGAVRPCNPPTPLAVV